MRIFITGASGFLGCHLAAELLNHDHVVGALVRPTTVPWRLTEFRERLTIVEGSLDDLAALREPLRSFAPDAVVHMAWRGVGNAECNSAVQARNVPDTVDVVSLAGEAGAKVFVGAGSQAEYGPYDRAIREQDITRPTTLYGIAKLASGLMAGQVCTERRMRFAWLRVFSTYGAKDADHWLIPTMIRTLRSGAHMALTSCEQRWGFLHARDAAAAFRLVLTNETARGVFNLGSPDAPPLRETVTRLRDLVDPGATLGFGEVPYRPDQVMVLSSDMSRLAALGWRPTVALGQGLRETVDWYDAARLAKQGR
jgi:nucleoside-diphosphate-sugar epimerase